MAVPQRVQDRAPSDSLTAYLNDVGHHELLTAADEVELAQAIEAGREALLQLESAKLSRSEKARLRRLVKAGDAARTRFLNANLRLVIAQARRFGNQHTLDLVDLIQEGNLGLIRAVEKFDWRKGFKFSTYATWWIRQAISRAVAEKSRSVRVPVHLHEKSAKVHAFVSQLKAELGRDPSITEIAEASGVEPHDVEDVLAIKDVLSLEEPIGEDGAAFGDFVADEDGDDPQQSVEQVLVGEDLRRAVGRLPERLALIMRLRYGFEDGVPWAMEDIGRKLGLTKERIRQLEKIALCRLRHPAFGMREEDLV